MIEELENQEESKIEIENNSVLLISEIQNKVILPYTKEEVKKKKRKEDNEYKTENEVIENVFTRPLDKYKDPFAARFKETYELTTQRDSYSKLDGIKLGLELFNKRYLHPAIITACRNTDELDVYLDCLSKNELEDFKIFEIKYELHPVIVKEKNDFSITTNKLEEFLNSIKSLFSIKILSIKIASIKKPKHSK